jgi:hypothetical protein
MTTVKRAARTGAGPCKPARSLIVDVPRRRSRKPMIKKKPAVITPWLNMSSTAPVVAICEPDITPRMIKPTWANEEYATRRLRSFDTAARAEP